jgi:predicted dehydrogenase
MRSKIGIIGCGKISSAYLNTLVSVGRPHVEVAACADLVPAAAQSCAEKFGIPRALSPEELLADPEIEFVANLTIPEAHESVTRAALQAGKHVYCEKPLALDWAAARELHALSRERGLLLSCAPDTLLGVAHQRARHLLDHGAIGLPADAFAQLQMAMQLPAHYMRAASGPLMDMGPYYIGALVFLLGPVRRVAALGARLPMKDPEGKTFTPEAPSRVGATLEFVSGVSAQLSLLNFGRPYAPRLEIFGSNGRLVCADPNHFEGTVLVDDAEPAVDFPEFPFARNDRGAGLIEMSLAVQEGRDCRLNADFCLHATEVMLRIRESIETGRMAVLETTCDRPQLMTPLPEAVAG